VTESRARLAIGLPSFAAADPGDWTHLLDAARLAEELGVDRVTVPEHVVLGEHLDQYSRPEIGGDRNGVQPTGPDGHFLDPLILLSMIAAGTTRVRLGTTILLAALRRPIVLAKQAATLDVLSGGRLDLGVGVGWQREEYDAAGLGFDRRGDLLDHTLDVCTTLWRDQRASHHSEHLDFDGIHLMPKPLQPGGLPVWVSGTVNPRSMRRLARFGSGWLPWGPAVADPLRAIPAMRAALTALGRDPTAIKVCANLPCQPDADARAIDEAMVGVSALIAAGVTDFRARVPDDPAACRQFLAHLVPRFRAVSDG